MIVSQGNFVKVIPQGQLKLLFPRDMIVPWEKGNFDREQSFPQGKARVPWGNICSKSFCNQNHFIFILYGHVIYYRKGLKDNYNFISGITSIRIHFKMLQSH